MKKSLLTTIFLSFFMILFSQESGKNDRIQNLLLSQEHIHISNQYELLRTPYMIGRFLF